jgi:hypothetical protein
LVLLPTIAALSKTRRTEFSMRSSALLVKLEPKPNSLLIFNQPKKETQFTTAIDAIKHGIPQVLLVDGHNPLTLLHRALSEGIHAQTDEECLELATSIRIVLAELADRMGTALKDHAELNTAVSRLMGSIPKNAPLQQVPSKVRVDPKDSST